MNNFSDPLIIENPPFQDIETLDFLGVTDKMVYDPSYSNPLLEGEFVEMFDGANTGKIKRAAKTTKFPLLYMGQVGRSDQQVSKKAPVCMENPLVIRTKIVDGTGLALGDEVMVDDVTYNALTRSGLKKAAGSGSYRFGVVMKAGSNTGAPDGKSYWTIYLYRQPIVIP